MCHRGRARWLSPSYEVALFLGMGLCLLWANMTMAQTQSQSSSDGAGFAQSGAGQSTAQVNQGGEAPPLRGSSGSSFVEAAPYVSVSERYDSNVLFSPQKMYDYVTNIRAGARVQYRDNFAEGALTAGLISEVYARNPGLNYVGTDIHLNANLDNAVGKMIRGLGLTVSDSFMYTPQPPAFVTPEVPASSFIRGIQVARNNTLMNNANILGAYAIAPLVRFNASYSHQMIKFLEQTNRIGALFNTTVQSIMAGPEYRITPSQSIGASYQYQNMSFEPSSGVGVTSSAGVQGIVATWKGALTRELTAEVSPGASLVTSNQGGLQWTARGLLQWSDGRTTAILSYTRGLFPAYFVSASVLISDNVTASFSQRLTSQWTVAAQSDYAHNTSIGQTSFRFDSFGQSVSVNYDLFAGVIVSASVNYNYFIQSSAGSESKFSRETGMLSLRKQWN